MLNRLDALTDGTVEAQDESTTQTYCSLYYIMSLTLREEDRLRVFENRVLRRIFGPKRDDVTGGWKKLHNEENNQIKEDEIGDACSTIG
jgi:hypothetical protein